ncbi:uncharacterized protein LOC143220394 [Lasioglossum baleicum]|uniref:uncharacterized protein LOC143220394 n=1 Tax=Lasioglossum baleicum TaxID=434251 RepID=UPI003FCE6958
MNYEESALRTEEGVVAVVGAIERLGFRISLEKTQANWCHSGRKKRVIPPARGKISVGVNAAQNGGKMNSPPPVEDGRSPVSTTANIGGPDERVRRIYAGVIRSMALYGAPVSAEELMARKKNRANVASV